MFTDLIQGPVECGSNWLPSVVSFLHFQKSKQQNLISEVCNICTYMAVIYMHICASLLQGLFEGVSHSFTKNFNFIDSVKAYLSYALLRASVSLSPVIFQVSVGCFLFIICFIYCSEVLKCPYNFVFLGSQYASGIFSVLLLRFRECLKV